MISIRRLIASMLAGALLVLVSAAQASAQPAPDLDRAVEGVALGLAAAAEFDGDGDVIVLDEGLIRSLEAIDAWFDKHDGTSNRQGQGQGPENAQAVHEMLLDGQIPGQLDKDTGSKLSELSGAYELLKGKSDEAKAAKDAKDKSNNGKSDDAPGKDRNDDKSSAESSRGQSRP
jgi:hypothetical protein